MSLYEDIYNSAAKTFQYEPIKKIKNGLRPVKHALVGKHGIYKAIEVARNLEIQRGSDVRTVFDVGAAVGEAAIPFLKGFPEAKVYCFEPMKDSYRKLQKAVAPYQDRVLLNNIGFFNEAGNKELHVTSYRDASSLLEIPEEFKKAGVREIGAEPIMLERLDDFVERNHIAKIDFLKIDVEGVEKEVLQGGEKTLREKVDNLFIEISIIRKGRYSSHYIDVLSMINRAGFALLDISNDENFFFSKLV